MIVEPEIVESIGLYEREENGRYWLARYAHITIDISNSVKSDPMCLQVTLITGEDALYRRFPFNVEVGLDGQIVKVLEFVRGEEEQFFTLPATDAGLVTFSVVSELASIPAEMNLGLDQRECALMARFAVVPGSHNADYRSAAPPAGPWVQSVVPTVERMPRPVFVVGMYRSGTSVLTWALGQHPNIWALEETGWLPMVASGILAGWTRARGAGRSFSKVYEIHEEQFLSYFGGAIDRLMRSVSKEHTIRVLLGRLSGHEPLFTPEIQILRSLGSSKQRWVDGTPENAMSISQLRMLFPKAQFIHIVRHPVEVVASMVHADRTGATASTADWALAAWRERVEMACLAERAYGSDVVMRIHYADLIAAPGASLRDIFSFLSEPQFDPAEQTFSLRINSSQVTPDEIAEVRNSLGADELHEAMQLYADASRRLDNPMMPDPVSRTMLGEIVGDATHRLLELFS